LLGTHKFALGVARIVALKKFSVKDTIDVSLASAKRASARMLRAGPAVSGQPPRVG
jgi:hypothetical protein